MMKAETNIVLIIIRGVYKVIKSVPLRRCCKPCWKPTMSDFYPLIVQAGRSVEGLMLWDLRLCEDVNDSFQQETDVDSRTP